MRRPVNHASNEATDVGMGQSPQQPRSALRGQALVALGGGAAIGLQLGLTQAYFLGRWRPILLSSIAGAIFGGAGLVLWAKVFPRFNRLGRAWAVALQALCAVVVMTAISFLVSYLVGLFAGGSTMFNPYSGGNRVVEIPAWRIAWGPFVTFALPILPAAFLVVMAFNRGWWQIFQLEKRETHARALAAQAQFEALRAQINPHFLFNSLNSIAQLISTDPAQAEACVERLAEVFRYLLRTGNQNFVSLGDELEIADAYLDIERARFGDRLQVSLRVDESLRRRRVPPLSLQPLVENAVRHGVSRKIGGGEVWIAAQLIGDELELTVGDTGVGIAGDTDSAFTRGVGLRNVHDRLVTLFGQRYAPSIESASGSGTRVTIRVPRVAGESGDHQELN